MNLDPAVLLAFPVFVLSVVVHECAHAWMALRCGDPTAAEAGRLTLDPRPHLHPFGTLLLPAGLLLAQTPFLFGWGRPVPVEGARLRRPHDDRVRVALAGPAANLLLAVACAALARIVPAEGPLAPLALMARAGVAVNCALALLHLIPLPPLDGVWALTRVLPLRHTLALHRFRRPALLLAALCVTLAVTGTPVATAPLRLAVDGCLALFGVGAPGAGS